MNNESEQKPISGTLGPIVDVLWPSFRQNLKRILEGVPIVLGAALAASEAVPERIRVGLMRMADYGWYLDSELTARQFFAIADRLGGRESTAAERLLAKYFRSNAERICTQSGTQFPERRAIIQSALLAHRERNFNASIPTILAQVDGICSETLGCQLFTQNKKALRRDVQEVFRRDPIQRALLAPIISPTPISRPVRPKQVPVTLNRHAVLHGLSLDYGTETNSLRVISLLGYSTWILSRPNKRMQLTRCGVTRAAGHPARRLARS